MEYKLILGALAVILQILSYGIYFLGIYRGKTKPHAFTWFVGGVINVIAFAAMIISGGGAGSWSIGVNTVLCFAVAGVGLYQKAVQYDLSDWLALAGGILGAILWGITKNSLAAVLLVAVSDVIAFVPTFRKAYRLPYEENASSFALGTINYIIALFALQTFTMTTWLYPAEIIVVDAALVILILIRRKKLLK